MLWEQLASKSYNELKSEPLHLCHGEGIEGIQTCAVNVYVPEGLRMYPMEMKLTMIKDADHFPIAFGVSLFESDADGSPSSEIVVGVKISSKSSSSVSLVFEHALACGFSGIGG
jgi:hypothetical protein